MSAVGQVLATVLWLYWLVLIGRLVFDFVPQDSHEPLQQAMLSVQETGRTTTLEMRFTRRYGESSWQTMRIGPVRQGG